MAIDPGETFARFLQNYQSYSSTAWCIANGGLNDHEAMETLATAAWKGTSNSKSINYALNLRVTLELSRECARMRLQLRVSNVHLGRLALTIWEFRTSER